MADGTDRAAELSPGNDRKQLGALEPYSVELAPAYSSDENAKQLIAALDNGETIRGGRHQLSRGQVVLNGEVVPVALKEFGREGLLKNWIDQKRGSKAERSFRNALHLFEHGVGTPEPIGFVEHWEHTRLLRSVYVCRLVEEPSDFREELLRLHESSAPCESFMSLMEVVAEGVAAMHECGFQHRDLGNQNILVKKIAPDFWGEVQFIDLNRGRVEPVLNVAARARDLSRIALPSDFKRIFIEMIYAPEVVPYNLKGLELRFRRRYELHTRSRKIRHLLRTLQQMKNSPKPKRRYPSPKEQFVWDPRTAQPVSVMVRKDRKKEASWKNHLLILRHTLAGYVPSRKRQAAFESIAFSEPVVMNDRIAVSIDFSEEFEGRQMALSNELGNPPVHLRFYHHEEEAEWQRGIALVKKLKAQGQAVSIALIQDREAVRNPERWANFCHVVIDALHDQVDFVEAGHAINRVKWGIWTMDEFRQLMEPVAVLKTRFPHVQFTGPAVIDFEFHYLATALRCLPEAFKFDAQSLHLYVDRRGAPENMQGKFATLQKLALARGIGQWSGRSGDRLVISEVNWPLLDTGVYSPVVSPYQSPGIRQNDPSVREDEYADYMIRYLLITLCSGLAERVCWWQLVARGYGLVDDSCSDAWRKRPAFHALKGFLALMRDARFERKLDSPSSVHLFMFSRRSEDFVIGYAEYDQGVELPFSVKAASQLEGAKMTEVDRRVTLSGRPMVFWL